MFSLVRVVLLVLMLCLSAMAQTVPIVITATDSSAALPVRFVSGLSPVSAMQFDVTLPASGLTFVSAASGVDLVAGKSVSASTVGTRLRVLVFGLNQTAIASGEVVKLNFRGVPGTYPLPVSGIVNSNPAGAQVASTGTDGTLLLP